MAVNFSPWRDFLRAKEIPREGNSPARAFGPLGSQEVGLPQWPFGPSRSLGGFPPALRAVGQRPGGLPPTGPSGRRSVEGWGLGHLLRRFPRGIPSPSRARSRVSSDLTVLLDPRGILLHGEASPRLWDNIPPLSVRPMFGTFGPSRWTLTQPRDPGLCSLESFGLSFTQPSPTLLLGPVSFGCLRGASLRSSILWYRSSDLHVSYDNVPFGRAKALPLFTLSPAT